MWQYVKSFVAKAGNINDFAWILSPKSYYGAGGGTSAFANLGGESPYVSVSTVINVPITIRCENGAMTVKIDNTQINTNSRVSFTGNKVGWYTNQNRIQYIKNIKLRIL